MSTTNTDGQRDKDAANTGSQQAFQQPFQQPEIHLNVLTADHGWKVLATFIGFGSIGGLAWVVAQQGWSDLAGTGIMLLFPFYTIQLIRNGLLNIHSRDSGDAKIEAGKNALRDIAGMIQAFVARSSYLRLFFISVAYMVGMLLFRAAAIHALSIFQNWVVSVCVFGLLSVFIIMPGLLAKTLRKMQARPGASK